MYKFTCGDPAVQVSCFSYSGGKERGVEYVVLNGTQKHYHVFCNKCAFLSLQHYRKTIEVSGSVSGLSLLIDVCSTLISFTMQPFVLMAATTSSCSTRKGSVPEMCTPSSWRWPMRKYDLWPLRRLAITQPVFFPPFALLSLEEAGEVPLALVRIFDRLCEGASDGGRTKKEKHRFGETPHSKHEHMEALTWMQT